MGMVELKSHEGTVSGYLAVPEKGNGPGVLVLHAWWGLNDFFTGFCDRLAAAGFVAFAPDMYRGAIASTRNEAKNLMSKVDDKTASRDIMNAVSGLQVHPTVRGKRLGLVGFSLGAFWSLWLAQEHPENIAAVVLFYGTGELKGANAQTAFLGHFAEKDEFEEDAYVRETERFLRTGAKEVTFHTYPGTGHWFFEQDRPDAYDAKASRVAWDRTLEFLKAHLSPKGA